MAKFMYKPLVAKRQVQYVLKTAAGYGAFTFEGIDAEERARACANKRKDIQLTIIKRIITEKELDA